MRAAQLLLAASAIALGASEEALAQTREQVDVSIGGTAGTNPFLLPGEDTESAAATLTVDPAVFVEDEVTTFTLRGQLRLQQYTSRYGTDTSARLNASGTTQLNERTSLSSSLGIRSSRSAAQDAFLTDSGDLLEAPVDAFPDFPQPDVTAAGRRARVSAIDATASVEHVLSPVERLGFGISVAHTETDQTGDHRVAGLQAAYRRQISVRTSAGATVNFGRADYLDQLGGDASFLTQMVGVEHQLNQHTSLSVQAGATFTSIEAGTGSNEQNVDLALSFDLCDRRSRQALCASGSRQARPTTFGGVSTVSSLGLSYSADIGETDRISFGGNYSRSTSVVADASVQNRKAEMLAFTARYSHDLNDRLSMFLAPGFTRTNTSDLFGGRSNLRVEVGIRLRIGR